jgi:uncharacterized membrane protein
MNVKKFSVNDIVSESWRAVKKNVWILAAVVLCYYLVVFVVSTLFSGSIGLAAMAGSRGGLPNVAVLVPYSLMMLTIFVISAVFYTGYYKMALMAADGEEVSLAAFAVSARKILNTLLASLLCLVLLIVGTLLCIIPGMIVAVRLQFFYFFIVDKDCGAVEALKKSWEATKGETLTMLLFLIVFYLLILLGVICCGVGVLVTMPMVMIGYALLYRKLTGSGAPDEAVQVEAAV